MSTAEDTALTFAASWDFDGVFSDPDTGDSLKAVKVVTRPAAAEGALALNGVAVTDNQVIAHSELGTLVFTPAANWNGAASFTFQVVDQSDTCSPATATATDHGDGGERRAGGGGARQEHGGGHGADVRGE